MSDDAFLPRSHDGSDADLCNGAQTMYTLVARSHARDSLLVEAPSLALSLVIAELAFKFHSFTLECLAFLGTWFVLSCLGHVLLRPWLRR